jgi:hypothetical protein
MLDRIKDLYEEASARVTQLRAQLDDAEVAADGLRNTLQGMGVDVGIGHHELSGPALRTEILAVLREGDPGRRGMHYQDIATRIVDRGHTISGRNKPANVIAHMSRSPYFDSLGRGSYTWRPDTDTVVDPDSKDSTQGGDADPTEEDVAGTLSDS